MQWKVQGERAILKSSERKLAILSGKFLDVSYVKPKGPGVRCLSRCMACLVSLCVIDVLRGTVPTSVRK